MVHFAGYKFECIYILIFTAFPVIRARSMTSFFTRISVFLVLFLVTTFKNKGVFATSSKSSKILADGPIDWFQN
jgi:hypothetical protein